jgi:hypothetical protein
VLKIEVYISQEQFPRAGAELAMLVAILQKTQEEKNTKVKHHTHMQKRNNKENA